nr:Rap1a/Tai family immunity protein [Sansalvadorimonas sp. 2012CJ34-2]
MPSADTGAVQNFAPIIDVNDFVSVCGDYQKISNSPALQRISKNWQRCYAYTSATISAMKDIERTAIVKQFCVPDNISPEYTMDLTIKYSRKVPEAKDENPAKVMLEALAVRYPC